MSLSIDQECKIHFATLRDRFKRCPQTQTQKSSL